MISVVWLEGRELRCVTTPSLWAAATLFTALRESGRGRNVRLWRGSELWAS